MAIDSEPQSLDPALISGVSEGRIATALFTGLTRLDPTTLEPVPGVAESWECSPDGLRWTFRLRADARWSDGTPVTAEDFRWSWLRVLDPTVASPYAGLLFDVRGARERLRGEADAAEVGLRAPEKLRLEVELLRPVPWFPSLAAFFTLLPVPRRAIEAHGSEWTRPGNLVGNGPYRLARHVFYREIVLERSAGPAAAGAPKRIRLHPVVDPNTQFNLYETGAVDLVFSVPPAILENLRDRPDFRTGPRLATFFLRLNVRRPAFADRRRRQALGLAVDREPLTARVLRGGERPTASLVPPGLPGYTPAAGPARDPDRARALLRDAGDPGPVTVLLPNRPGYAALATVLQHDLARDLGLTLRLDVREWKVYLQAMRGLEYDIALGQWIGDYPDPSTFLDCFLSDSGNNRTGWRSERYDELIGSSRRTAGPERNRLLWEAEALLLAEAPIVPLYHPTVQYLVAPRVGGLAPNPMGLVRFDALRVEGGRE